MHLHAADVIALFVATENTTRPSGKLHVCSCPTSLQNFDNFTAVVARLHCSSFLNGLLSGGKLQERFQYFAVCSVDGDGVQRGEVDACGVLGVVSHAFADDGQWYVFASGDACPGVSADVHGEGYGQAQTVADGLQMAVDAVCGIDVLAARLHFAGRTDDGQQVGRMGVVVAMDDFLHTFFPLDEELLTGFASAIRQHASAEVFLPQIGDVDKRHAAGVEGEEEHVAGKGECGRVGEVHLPDAPDGLERNGSLHGLVHTGIDVPEGVALHGQVLLYCAVVDGSEYSHVERSGVGPHAVAPQIGLVGLHHVGIHLVKCQVAPLAKASETAERGCIRLRSALLAQGFQLCYNLLHEGKEMVCGVVGCVVCWGVVCCTAPVGVPCIAGVLLKTACSHSDAVVRSATRVRRAEVNLYCCHTKTDLKCFLSIGFR